MTTGSYQSRPRPAHKFNDLIPRAKQGAKFCYTYYKCAEIPGMVFNEVLILQSVQMKSVKRKSKTEDFLKKKRSDNKLKD